MTAAKNILKYTVSFLIAFLLLWYVYRDLDISAMLDKLMNADYFWIAIAMAVFFISHIARAYRWNLLLAPLGYRYLTVFRTFLAVMVGYFANLIIPRMGEVSRCGLLRRTDNIPIATSLGSVVAERIVDFCSLIFLTTVLFILEFERLKDFFFSFFKSAAGQAGQYVFAVYVLIGIMLLLMILFFIFGRVLKEKFKHNTTFNKMRHFAREVAQGLASLKNIENKAGFWLATLVMWVAYFFMSYLMFFALPETAGLGWGAGLSVLVMGGLGMSAPVQGGIGTFHALVSGVLLLYGISETDGVLFATLVHGTQTLAFIFFGGISFFIASLIATKKTPVREEVQASD